MVKFLVMINRMETADFYYQGVGTARVSFRLSRMVAQVFASSQTMGKSHIDSQRRPFAAEFSRKF